ncbi:hypothetical protein Kole_0582 [Kosmotoga olearia TBF 19.5.1]|uniref:Uncharacterized protein n=2 Tax=Kosmotogaceae TaxID=1643948 RepID=C5CEW7_KOSOT|nr:hypothetical protein Kole_0582 [Kosmotoga olearia TBF 19.5.1]
MKYGIRIESPRFGKHDFVVGTNPFGIGTTGCASGANSFRVVPNCFAVVMRAQKRSVVFILIFSGSRLLGFSMFFEQPTTIIVIGVINGMKKFIAVMFLMVLLLRFALAEGIPEEILPIFAIPEYDKSNGIVEVFVSQKECVRGIDYEITVVFKDEDHPDCFINVIYDIYRFFKYGRIEDIETFHIITDKNGKLLELRFFGTFSGKHHFKDTKDLHGDAIIPFNEVVFRDGRPVICVNTWNHMFGIDPSFELEEMLLIKDYEVSEGTRYDAEVEYSFLY